VTGALGCERAEPQQRVTGLIQLALYPLGATSGSQSAALVEFGSTRSQDHRTRGCSLAFRNSL